MLLVLHPLTQAQEDLILKENTISLDQISLVKTVVLQALDSQVVDVGVVVMLVLAGDSGGLGRGVVGVFLAWLTTL
jgi:hypothetical protein